MTVPTSLQAIFDWLQSVALSRPELAGIGLIAACLIVLLLALWLIRRILRWLSTAGSAVSAGAKGRKSQIGYRILLSPLEGRGGGAMFKFLASAGDKHMSSFSFDAPLQLSRTARIKGGRSAKAERAARKRLKRSDADMIVWGERLGRGVDGFCVFSLSRAGGLKASEAIFDQFLLPTSSKLRGDDVQRVAAYLLAKRLQPSLGRPADFRAERLEPVAVQLEELLGDAKHLAPSVYQELERDFSAAALHVGESNKDQSWLEKVVTLRRATLERLGDKPQPGVWAEAKLDLGCALIASAAGKFDASIVTEGSVHLRDAIEVLKTEPSIRRAEDAIRTLESARQLTANRDRFSINFNG